MYLGTHTSRSLTCITAHVVSTFTLLQLKDMARLVDPPKKYLRKTNPKLEQPRGYRQEFFGSSFVPKSIKKAFNKSSTNRSRKIRKFNAKSFPKWSRTRCANSFKMNGKTDSKLRVLCSFGCRLGGFYTTFIEHGTEKGAENDPNRAKRVPR